MATALAGPIDVVALKRRHPVADVLTSYGVALRVVGRTLVGRCLLHEDGGRPNLCAYPSADPAADSWYCFRCHAGGDAIALVMRHERLRFAAACARLDGLPPVGATRVAPPPAPAPERSWERLALEEQVVMDTALDLYQHRLRHAPRARAYLAARGLPESLVREAGLGYADGHSLEAFLRRRWGLGVAQELGLLRRPARADDGRPLREFLAGRIVVPELRGGRAIWFVGRLLDDDPVRPKYLALRGHRPVLGFEHAAGEPTAFLVEGVFDYLTARAWRLPACTPCGTHLPPGRLGFLHTARTVYGVLHADPAGRDAAERFGAHLGGRWRPVVLPEGKDLNDLGRERGGRAAFCGLVRAARDTRRGHEGAA